MVYGALIGGGVGSIVGGIAGAFEAAQRAKEIRATKRNVRGGIDIGAAEMARSAANIMTSKEYLTASNFIRGMFGLGDVSGEIGQKLLGEYGAPHMGAQSTTKKAARARAVMGADANEVLAQGLAANAGAGTQFTQGGTLTPLETDFLKNLRAAQAARGIEMSAAAGAGEAAGLAAFRTQIQMQMVPQLMALAEAPAAMRAKYEGSYLSRNVFYNTGGAVAYGQAQPGLAHEGSVLVGAMKGGAAGFAQGLSIGNLFGGLGGSGSGGKDITQMTPAQIAAYLGTDNPRKFPTM